MIRSPRSTRLLPALLATALLAAFAAVPGCSRNTPGTILAPTGIRPAPSTYPGSVSGYVFFDPDHTPDLATAPFPPTEVKLYSGSTLVATDSLADTSRVFHFRNVPAGEYSVVVRSWAFLPRSRGGLHVFDGELDAGNLNLVIDPSIFSSSIDVIGSMPDYGLDQLGMGTVTFLQNTLGIWTLSSVDNLFMPPPALPRGTYHFKFVNSYASTTHNLIGWGWSAKDTLTAPVVSHAVRQCSGDSTDIVVKIPVAGQYRFMLDERRQRFTIQLESTAAARTARRRS